MTTIDLRGRDLIIIPSEELLHLSTSELLQALFGSYLPFTIHNNMGRDKRHHFLRTQPIHFSSVKSALRKQQTSFTVAFEEHPTLPFETVLSIEPRPYQMEALARWLAEGSAGVVVLPTGAGKTFVAAMAIHETHLWTLAVVPTLDLLQQWRSALASSLSISTGEIGVFGGGEKELKPITIITYDSAVLYPRELRRFGLLIFDDFWVIDQCKQTFSFFPILRCLKQTVVEPHELVERSPREIERCSWSVLILGVHTL